MNVPLINPKTDLSVQEADLMVNRNLEGTVTGKHLFLGSPYGDDSFRIF